MVTFLSEIEKAFEADCLLKITLSKLRKHADAAPNNIYLRPVEIKGERVFSATLRYATKDETKNMALRDGLRFVEEALENTFLEAVLFTEKEEIALKTSRKGKRQVLRKKNKNHIKAEKEHNRQKARLLSADEPWLTDLGITNAQGEVLKNAQAKWKQINKFLEIIDALLGEHPLGNHCQIADMGSGKGYLTFALFSFLKNEKHLQNVQVAGIELRPELVDLCNKTAQKHDLDGLQFVASDINDFKAGKLDMLIALHACDTATDLAIAKALEHEAGIIVLAPCCHKQIRRQMAPQNELAPLLQHGILLERQSEMLTDGIRALLLESEGYHSKVFEFISAEHTAKNVMITATKKTQFQEEKRQEALSQIAALKTAFGIQEHYLEKLVRK